MPTATKRRSMSSMPDPNGHGIDDATKMNCHASSPLSNPLPEGEGTNERSREFYVYAGRLRPVFSD
jgi:hypothetical protein